MLPHLLARISWILSPSFQTLINEGPFERVSPAECLCFTILFTRKRLICSAYSVQSNRQRLTFSNLNRCTYFKPVNFNVQMITVKTSTSAIAVTVELLFFASKALSWCMCHVFPRWHPNKKNEKKEPFVSNVSRRTIWHVIMKVNCNVLTTKNFEQHVCVHGWQNILYNVWDHFGDTKLIAVVWNAISQRWRFFRRKSFNCNLVSRRRVLEG